MNLRFAAAVLAGPLFALGAPAHAGTAHFTLTEATSGSWDVFVEVGGADTSGLASYNLQLVELSPGENESIIWSQNVLGNLEEGTFAQRGFQPNQPLQAPVGSTEFSASNSQFGDGSPVYGIGLTPVFVEGADAASSPDIDLGVPAFLGTLSTPAGLTASNFAPNANLFDESQTNNSVLGSVSVTQTVTPVPEPASATLLAAAGLGLLAWRRRRAS